MDLICILKQYSEEASWASPDAKGFLTWEDAPSEEAVPLRAEVTPFMLRAT